MTIQDREVRQSEFRRVDDTAAIDPFGLWQLTLLSPEDFAALGTAGDDLSREQLEHLAAYNLLAPTSHNTVPQRFVFPSQGNAIDICLDRDVVLSASDPSGRQACISVGCGIANLLHAARRYGFEGEVELHDAPVLPRNSEESRYARVARIRFQRAAAAGPEAVLHAMLERRSVRALYDAAVRLPLTFVEQARELVRSRYPELEFHLLQDEAALGFLGELQELADSTALNREDFTTELGHWLIENDSEAPVGMRGREFGMSDEMTSGMHARLLSDTPLSPDEVAAFAKGGNFGIRSSSAVGILCASPDDLRHRLLAGRAFEDLVLTLHQHGFVTAMHASITELESPNLALQARLGSRGRALVVFRMGRPLDPSDAQRPHSARPNVSEVTVTESALSVLPARAAS